MNEYQTISRMIGEIRWSATHKEKGQVKNGRPFKRFEDLGKSRKDFYARIGISCQAELDRWMKNKKRKDS